MLNLGLTHHPTAKHYRDIINLAGKIRCSLSGLNVSIRNRSVPLLQGGVRGGFVRKTLLNPHFTKGGSERLQVFRSLLLISISLGERSHYEAGLNILITALRVLKVK